MAIQTRREVECFSDHGEMLRVEAERIVAQASARDDASRSVPLLPGGRSHTQASV